MAQPKKRTSKSKKNSRKAQWLKELELPELVSGPGEFNHIKVPRRVRNSLKHESSREVLMKKYHLDY